MKVSDKQYDAHKMLIVMDRKKIESEKKYSYRKILYALDDAFQKHGMTKDKNGWYTGGTFEVIGGAFIGLSKMDWFMENVKQWLWFDCETGELIDFIEECKERGEL